MENNFKKQPESISKIDRRKALAKTGKYAAFTALTMMAVLVPQRSVAAESPGNVPSRLPQKR